MFEIKIGRGDVLKTPTNALILKHANGFHGVDNAVAERIGFREVIPKGSWKVVAGKGISARNVVFLGVGPLHEFQYEQIRQFAKDALRICAVELPSTTKMAMPIHGPGYGLDEKEAFLSLIGGLIDGASAGEFGEKLEAVEIVERNPVRYERLGRLLASYRPEAAPHETAPASTEESISLMIRPVGSIHDDRIADNSAVRSLETQLKKFGRDVESKVRLVAAMPFKAEYDDEWLISIVEATAANDILCERLDQQAFIGDVLSEIKARIEKYDGVIAVLNDANPNVFLEIGYAWAKDKPTILVIKDGQTPPFDVRGQRCLIYKGINDLRTKLREELKALMARGIFGR